MNHQERLRIGIYSDFADEVATFRDFAELNFFSLRLCGITGSACILLSIFCTENVHLFFKLIDDYLHVKTKYLWIWRKCSFFLLPSRVSSLIELMSMRLKNLNCVQPRSTVFVNVQVNVENLVIESQKSGKILLNIPRAPWILRRSDDSFCKLSDFAKKKALNINFLAVTLFSIESEW